ncbi:MAG TPA: glycosyltransferase family 39 protein [Candidatus Angelobacter sp.]
MSTQPVAGAASSFQSSDSAADRRKIFLFLIVLVWAAIYVSSIFQPALLDDADTVHSEAAREMLTTHDWVTLHINQGFRYLEKAPLMYWAVAASFKVFGVHDWSARLPIALGVLALLLVVYRLGRRIYGEEGGFYSALVVATGFGPFLFTRILIPDMAVALWLALGFDFFLTSLEQEKPSRRVCWGLAATMALNILTKGLIGLAFPVGTILIFLFLTGKLRHLLKLRLFSSFIVFLGIATPWHLLAGFANPAQGAAKGFFWFYFVNEQVLRFLKERYPNDYDTVPLWLFWGLTFVWLMPWTAFIYQAVKQAPFRLREWRSGLTERRRGTALFAIWALVVLLFFAVSSRQEYYIIPGLPGIALLIGGWLAQETVSPADSRERRSGRISSLVLMAVGGIVCAATVYLALQSQAPPADYDIAELLKKNPDAYRLSFGHFLDLTPKALGAFKLPLLLTGIAFAAGTIVNWLLRRTARTFPANLALAAMMVVILLQAHTGLVIFSPVLSSKALADKIGSVWQPGDLIEVNGDYEAASTLPYYLQKQIRMLNGRDSNIWYGSLFPDAPNLFDDNVSFEKLWHGGTRIFFWTEEETVLRDSDAITEYSRTWYEDEDNRAEGERRAAATNHTLTEDERQREYDRIATKVRREKQEFENWKQDAYQRVGRGKSASYGIPAYVQSAHCELAKWGGKLILTNELKLCPQPVPAGAR